MKKNNHNFIRFLPFEMISELKIPILGNVTMVKIDFILKILKIKLFLVYQKHVPKLEKVFTFASVVVG